MDPLNVECPKCGAWPHERCRTLTTGRITDTHADRWFAYNAQRSARMRLP